MELMTAKKHNKKYGVVDLDALEAAARAKAAPVRTRGVV